MLANILYTLATTVLLLFVRWCWYRLIDPPHKKKAVASSRAMMERMRRKGMEKYLLRDCSFQTSLTAADCKDMVQLETKLSAVMREFLYAVNLAPDMHLKVYLDKHGTMNPDGRGGDYAHAKKLINVYCRPEFSPMQLIAIVCHECSHCFLYRNGLASADPVENERLTDITACLLGFGQYMISGNYTLGSTRSRTRRGYLKSAEMQAIYNDLLSWRRQRSDQARNAPAQSGPEKKPVKSAEARLKGHIDSARAMIPQARAAMAAHKVPTRTDLTQEDYVKLYETARAIDSGRLTEALHRCEAALGKDDASLQAADAKAVEIIEALDRVLRAFR